MKTGQTVPDVAYIVGVVIATCAFQAFLGWTLREGFAESSQAALACAKATERVTKQVEASETALRGMVTMESEQLAAESTRLQRAIQQQERLITRLLQATESEPNFRMRLLERLDALEQREPDGE